MRVVVLRPPSVSDRESAWPRTRHRSWDHDLPKVGTVHEPCRGPSSNLRPVKPDNRPARSPHRARPFRDFDRRVHDSLARQTGCAAASHAKRGSCRMMRVREQGAPAAKRLHLRVTYGVRVSPFNPVVPLANWTVTGSSICMSARATGEAYARRQRRIARGMSA